MCECVGREKYEISKDELDGMDGTSVLIAKWCARTCVVEQDWEVSILSQLRTKLMCHLA